MKKYRDAYDLLIQFMNLIGLKFDINDDIELMIKKYGVIINSDILKQ